MQERRQQRTFEMLLHWGIIISMIYASNGEELLELSCLNEMSCKHYQQSDMVATCVNNQCECRDSGGQRVPCQPSPSVLKKSNFIGGECPCRQPNAECNKAQGICYCAIGYTPSKDLRRCLKIQVPLDDACELDIQCQAHDAFAICETEKKICQCRSGYQEWEGICAARLGVISPACDGDSDCHRFSLAAKCAGTNGCLCDIGYVGVANMSACLPAVGLNAACKESAQCQSSVGAAGMCLQGKCTCDIMYEAQPLLTNRTKVMCVHKLVLGKYCRNDEQCLDQFAAEQTMICDFGQCNCRIGYISTDNSIFCRRNNAFKTKSALWLLLILLGLIFGEAIMHTRSAMNKKPNTQLI